MTNFLRRYGRASALLLSVLATTGMADPAPALERGPAPRPVTASADTEARVIVKYRADSTLMQPLASGATVAPQQAAALSNRLGLTLTDGRAIGARAQVLRAQGMRSQDLADRLAVESDIEYAVVDQRVHAYAAPNDPLYSSGQTAVTPSAGQWYLRTPTSNTIVDATSIVSSINVEPAWNITTGSSSVVVAVLDTGVRRDHPDLSSKLLAGYDFISDATVSNDGDGRDSDPSDPGDSTSGSTTSSWHGTQTAGLIGAATNNGIGMASVGRDVMLLPVRVLGVGGGYASDVEAGMLWAAALSSTPVANPTPARVINLSLGAAGTCSKDYADAISQVVAANVVVVAAAGNDGLAVGAPANCAGVVAVAGVRHAGTKVGYSDLGSQIAIAAPAGNCVNTTGTCLFPLLTTSNSGVYAPVSNAAGGSIYTSGGDDASLGTSFSAPLVSGTVGLMLSANPALTPAQVLAALKSTARPFPTSGSGSTVATCTAPTAVAQSSECYCTTSTCGAGLLDAGAAVQAVAMASANIAVASTAVTSGATVTLDGSASRASTSTASIAAYQWAIVSGAAMATFTSSTNAPVSSLQTSGTGTVVVSLTVTDSVGRQATSTVTLSVSAPVATPTTSTGASSSTSSGGGGAMGAEWLLVWLAAVLVLRGVSRGK